MQDPKHGAGRLTLLSVGTVMGICIAAGAWIWGALGSPEAAWSPEQAKALKAAYEAVHAARGEGGPVEDGSAELERAEALANRLEADLEQARSFRSTWATRVVAAGLALTIACGLGYLALRDG
jgi:hypothetical protein